MGKKPFSAKAKREQLRQKRQAASSGSNATLSSPRQNNQQQQNQQQQQNVQQQQQTMSTSSSSSSTPIQLPNISTISRYSRNRSSRSSGLTHSQRYKLQLTNDNNNNNNKTQQIQEELKSNDEIFKPLLNKFNAIEMDINEIRPYPNNKFIMPKRPKWNVNDTQQVIDKREMKMLYEWNKNISSNNNYYEHNLETWRQLWRVIERSDVLILVADIRYPILHFVPDLYYYVINHLKKGFIFALNKCDLVSNNIINSWKCYFQTNYPKMSVALFSSFPDEKLSKSKYNDSNLLSKRERKMARSKLSAWGADQLLFAIDKLDDQFITSEKRSYLKQWRQQLNDQSNNSKDSAGDALSHNSIKTNEKEYVYGNEEEYLQNERMRHKRREARKKRAALRKRKRNQKDEDETTEQVEHYTDTNVNLNDTEEDNDDIEMDSDSDESDIEIESNESSKTKNNNDDFDINNKIYDKISDDFITIGVVGHPNAGKSSLINGIFRKKVVSTSKTPGHTKHLQTIFLTKNVRLCDCPGLVFPSLSSKDLQIIAGMFPIAQVRQPIKIVNFIAQHINLADILKLNSEIKKLEDFLLDDPNTYLQNGWNAWKICEAWAMKRGYRTAKAARLDVSRAANHILRLTLEGRVVLATTPKGFSDSNFNMNNNSIDNESEKDHNLIDAQKIERNHIPNHSNIENNSMHQDSSVNQLSRNEEEEEYIEENGDDNDEASSDEEGNDNDDEGEEEETKPIVLNSFALLDEDLEE